MTGGGIDPPLLEVRDLHVGYYRELSIIKGVTIRAHRGQITALLGSNGVGKSTLLKAIAGFLAPTSGDVLLAGVSILNVAPHEMISHGVSYMAQRRGIFGEMTVQENLLLGAWSFRSDRPQVSSQLSIAYERFPALWQKRDQKAGELSGGQQRMVELGRALMCDPSLILVDEPTAGLARNIWESVYAMLVDLSREGRAIVLVDQEIRAALKVASYVYVLDLGRNRAEGPPDQFLDVERSFWIDGSTRTDEQGGQREVR
jgi:branched-chain amino acid transport system ATP-binding protein